MVVDDIYFMNALKGKRIKLTLKSSVFFGVVQRINANKTLVLSEVTFNGSKIAGTKLFFGREIVNVEFDCVAKAKAGNIHQGLEEKLKFETIQPFKQATTWDADDENEDEYMNFVVIDQFHDSFGPALMHIKKQHVVGVGAEGVEIYKNGRLCWLKIATKSKIYLFDVLLLGAQAFKNGLSMVLESKHILKVVHDCRAIAGCLTTQFGVKLANVFDTQVADFLVFHSETGGFLPSRVSSLEEVLKLHLKVPSCQISSLKRKSQLSKEDREIWFLRPCPIPLLKVMSLSVVHLQPLRLLLLDRLMADFMYLVDSYLTGSSYLPDQLEALNMESVLELPSELRQLEQMYQERRQQAAGHYSTTKDGLLARFKAPLQPSTPSPAAAVERKQLDFPALAMKEPPTSPGKEILEKVHPPSDIQASSVGIVGPHSPLEQAEGSEDRIWSSSSPSAGLEIQRVEADHGRKEELCIAALPPIGRGFCFQAAAAKAPKERSEGISTLLKMPPSGSKQNLSQDPAVPSGPGGQCPAPESLTSLLARSFRAFRQ